MKAIVYTSQALIAFSPEYIKTLAAKFAQHNQENNISGYLWYQNNQFLQYIEGDDESVDQLMLNISCDSRHSIISSLCTTLDFAKFSTWGMKYFGKEQRADVYMGLVSTLGSQLLMIQASKSGMVATETSVWRSVDILAKHQTKL